MHIVDPLKFTTQGISHFRCNVRYSATSAVYRGVDRMWNGCTDKEKSRIAEGKCTNASTHGGVTRVA